MLASGRFINSKRGYTFYTIEGIDLSVESLEYCSVSDGKRNIGKDFAAVGKDFKKATEQAKNRTDYGKRATAK